MESEKMDFIAFFRVILALPAVLAANLVLAQSSVVVLHQFAGTDGAQPYARLVEGADGALYGTTTSSTGASGAVVGSGTVFRITKAGVVTTLHTFTDSSPPSAGVVFGTDGNLYGTTGYDCGGAPAGTNGTVFVMTPSGQDFTTLQSFAGDPAGALTLASDGNFYGVTNDSVFRMTPGGTVTPLHTFAATEGSGLCRLAEVSADLFLGGASGGGSYGVPSGGGTLFQITSAGAVSVIQSFSPVTVPLGPPCDDTDVSGGSTPVGGPTLGADGSFFGLLYCAADDEQAGFYTLSSAGAFSPLNAPQNSLRGYYVPAGSLTPGSDGRLYGVMSSADGTGSAGSGALFAMTTNGDLTFLYKFPGQGISPEGGVIQASDGRFYGVTIAGPTNDGTPSPGFGSVYQLTLPPTAPTGVKATGSAGTVTITWNSVLTASSYNVFVGMAPGAEGQSPSRTDITGTSVSINDAQNGTTYFLKVAAVNAAGVGPKSAEVSAEPSAPPPPPAPSGSSGGGSIDWLGISGLVSLIAARRFRQSRSPAS
jgi:uncharacterized repeat protein (TIGR03803 family)